MAGLNTDARPKPSQYSFQQSLPRGLPLRPKYQRAKGLHLDAWFDYRRMTLSDFGSHCSEASQPTAVSRLGKRWRVCAENVGKNTWRWSTCFLAESCPNVVCSMTNNLSIAARIPLDALAL